MKKTFNKIFAKGQKSPLYEQPLDISFIDDCNFYHTTDIPGSGVAEGQWDCRWAGVVRAWSVVLSSATGGQ